MLSTAIQAQRRTAGRNKKIGTGRKAEKLRITAPGAIIIMRVAGLHLEQSRIFGSQVVLAVWICTKRQLEEPAPPHTPIFIQALSKGTVTIIPDVPGENIRQPFLKLLCLHRWGLKLTSEPQIQMFLYLAKQELGEDLLIEHFAAN